MLRLCGCASVLSGGGKRQAGSAHPASRRLPTSRFPLPVVLAVLQLTGCAARRPADVTPQPTAPLPTAGLAGQKVVVFPLTLIAADEHLGWQKPLTPRRAALERADSVLGDMLTSRSPEVTWVLPPELRQAARRGVGVASDPDQMATSLLRSSGLRQLPDPLWSQMRTLAAIAGDRYVLVPASLIFLPATGGATGGQAEMTLVLADVRTGAIGWRTVARGDGADPWTALQQALKGLAPELP
jgi:hypothetical protein